MNVLDTIANWIIISCTVPLGWFIARYFWRSPYGRTREGVLVMITKVAMFLILALGGVGLFFPDYFGRSFVRLALYVALTIFFWIDLSLLLSIQKKYPYNRNQKTRSKEK
jgi:hypothetical protein